MAKFLLSFVSILVAAGAIIGLYLALDFVKLVWLFWIVVVVCVLLAAGSRLRPLLVKAVRQWRSVPGLEGRVRALETRVIKLKASRDLARAGLISARRIGLAEGQAQVIGAVLAATVEPPRIVGIANFGGEVSLVALAGAQPLPISARFRVVFATTKQLKGIVQVAEFDDVNQIYYLTCVEATTPEFWAALRDKVELDPRPPDGVLLERFLIPPRAESTPLNSVKNQPSVPEVEE